MLTLLLDTIQQSTKILTSRSATFYVSGGSVRASKRVSVLGVRVCVRACVRVCVCVCACVCARV